ncbi:hypothetical protein [Clostridium cylindrosporum]|uniref:Uncharacterized protein n=1 Tax=Clostridium cylindrosporum DSM 605 TaxID=1121307 RepID=A0A0J8D605_CLOCY|nr:hypothetical protein [Clostridium cylindrosporum]KMT21525.1 hypothetical protein CLCY_2c02860 [Clostridium cylindrosporum DSM 605]
MALLTQFLITLIIAIVALVAYNFLKPFIFKKAIPNKWVILSLLIIAFFTPLLLPMLYSNIIGSSIFFILITLLALTFVDVLRIEKAEKNKPIVGKPKAKPNRSNKNPR